MRLFVAIYPPPEIARALSELLKPGADLPAHRLVAVEQIHMTVLFIGLIEPGARDDVIESVERSVAGLESFELCMQHVIALPQREHARVIAVKTDRPPTLLEIHQRLVIRLARNPKAQSAREFLPHLTIARLKPAQTVTLDDMADVSALRFTVRAIHLMQSTLTAQGAVHKTLHTQLLQDAGVDYVAPSNDR